jgi:type IV pilus assembly protein PilW
MNPAHKQSLTRPLNRSSGFTVVELMVGMVIGLIIIASSAALYLGGKQTSRLNRELTYTQDAGRLILDLMARDLRAAGDFGCPSPNARINTLRNPGTIDLAAFGITGLTQAALVAGTSPRQGSALVTNAGALSDGFAIASVTGELSPVVSQMADVNSPVVVRQADGFSDGDIAVISDCLQAAVFQITSLATSGGLTTIGHAASSTGAGSGNTTDNLGIRFNVGAEVGRVDTTWWFIGQPADRPRGLYRVSASRNQIALVSERVRAMVIRYQVDTNDDNVPDQLDVDATAVTNWRQVMSARVSLLLRSQNQVMETPAPYFFNGQTVTPTDRFLYMPVEVSVRVRNRE